eukprot:CAMPEP_0202916932 /NCGR_PEP_ID=MMETSP1392-20130828/69802_1 /ASSEMBLY_ACC=CAM_ASM_000868 /TAXON_ID=225041 /ORGANISM="Chlamydomonas chlamydogama, Strain SAG 11-48b" /LENGTH=46 /DNA_ID= /DNA_START= /DNA_END= /DNA_ORIENTATION=
MAARSNAERRSSDQGQEARQEGPGGSGPLIKVHRASSSGSIWEDQP